jgi:probable HAF family extracellular repeat protein
MSFKLSAIVSVLLLDAALSAPLRCQAQPATLHLNPVHHHYKLIDMGTLGGPQSIVFEQGTRSLNNRGTLSGCADTPVFDPDNPQNSYFLYPDAELDPYIQHVFQWRNGKVTDLGASPGGTSSCTQWISDAGWIVGGSTNGTVDPLAGYPEVNATLWTGGHTYNLGTFGGNQSLAWSVNDKRQIVGFALNTTPDAFAGSVFAFGTTQARAFLWENGHLEELGTLGGPDSDALIVNDRGQVAGMSTTNRTINPNTQQPTVDPFFWENGKMIDLGTLGGVSGYPNAINHHGQVVGASNLEGDQVSHAFLWDGGIMKDLGTLGGNFSEARWINNTGEVAGWATLTGDPGSHATLWKDGKITDLGALPGSPCSYANGINSLGQILGAAQQCPNSAPRVAFLWENGEMVDLNSLVLPGSNLFLWTANNANDRGEIVADGTLPTGENHAVLLIPCDEEHLDIDGCDYSLVERSDTAQIQAQPAPAIGAKLSPTPPGRISFLQMLNQRKRFADSSSK